MSDYGFLLKSEIPECAEACLKCGVSCPIEDCRQWIDYEEDYNCTSIAVGKNGSMSLREVADRMHVSFVRIKQIEDKALIKLKKGLIREFDVRGDAIREFILAAFGGFSSNPQNSVAKAKNRLARQAQRIASRSSRKKRR